MGNNFLIRVYLLVIALGLLCAKCNIKKDPEDFVGFYSAESDHSKFNFAMAAMNTFFRLNLKQIAEEEFSKSFDSGELINMKITSLTFNRLHICASKDRAKTRDFLLKISVVGPTPWSFKDILLLISQREQSFEIRARESAQRLNYQLIDGSLRTRILKIERSYTHHSDEKSILMFSCVQGKLVQTQ